MLRADHLRLAPVELRAFLRRVERDLIRAFSSLELRACSSIFSFEGFLLLILDSGNPSGAFNANKVNQFSPKDTSLNIINHGHHNKDRRTRCEVSSKSDCLSIRRSQCSHPCKTSLDKTGSDAMNAAGDYSAAYCILHTDGHLEGHGMTFTIGRGNEIVCAAINLLSDRVKGKSLEWLVADWGKTWRYLVADSQLRWIGPEKGVIHLALGALVNAIWDLWAKSLNKPVWRIVADMTPEEYVKCIDFRYITDAITPEEAVSLLKEVEGGKAERIKHAEESRAVPAYTTSAGWLGYGREKMKGLLEETLAKGYRHFKIKVGTSIEEDKIRLGIAREVIGYDKGNVLMVDANQVRINSRPSFSEELANILSAGVVCSRSH